MQRYDHYIAVDWSMSSMAIARLTGENERLSLKETPASVADLKAYLKSLRGRKILTVEESNSSQWLYVELNSHVDKFLMCDPHRNRLLSDGPKTDKIDAKKLVHLLKAGLMKEVFHTADETIYLRKLTSHYQDLVRMGVMKKNQRSALFRSYGLCHKKDNFSGNHSLEGFVLGHLDIQIQSYEEIKKEYEAKFKEFAKSSKNARLLKSIPGVGDVHAVELLALIVDAKRFPTLGHLYSYAGLIRHEKISGGRYYGDRKPRSSHELKRVMKMITYAALRGSENKVTKYYRHLIEKGVAGHNARHACTRKIAAYTYGILRTERKLEPSKY